ncbi:MAG TPA: glycoside hydrolase, partial [Acidimicrobiales bacterium]|nr:glycoside hydrolase [Acidimicrobiales bacterium]
MRSLRARRARLVGLASLVAAVSATVGLTVLPGGRSSGVLGASSAGRPRYGTTAAVAVAPVSARAAAGAPSQGSSTRPAMRSGSPRPAAPVGAQAPAPANSSRPTWGGVAAPAAYYGSAPRGSAPHVVTSGPVSASVESQAQQQIDGFGASGGWWPNALGHFPASAKQKLGRLLFSPEGLELSQYRYNIGGGGVAVTDRYKAPPSFLQPNGTYDWNADPNGMQFLQMAAGYHVPQLIGFVNSAPAQFTSDGKSCGGILSPAGISGYARFLADVVEHLDSVDHIRLSYISPMNEPDTSQPTCRQEGMAVPVSERATAFNAISAALTSTPAHPGVIGDES